MPLAPAEINSSACSPATLAGTILDAWLCGDQLRLTTELDRTLRVSPRGTRDVESDEMEILLAIASRMRCRTNLFAPRSADPRIGLWVDLLQHISRPAATSIDPDLFARGTAIEVASFA